MTTNKKKAWIIAVFVTIMVGFVLPALPLGWAIAGLVAVCLLVFR